MNTPVLDFDYLYQLWCTLFHSLSINFIESSGAASLCDALRVNHTLRELE